MYERNYVSQYIYENKNQIKSNQSKFVWKGGRVWKYLETYFLLPFISMEEERLGWDLSLERVVAR